MSYKKGKWLLLTLLLSLIIIWPLFKSGFWESDDGEWMVIRFTSFHESLRDGHFPVRWTQRLNRSYGYSVFNFLYPLPFYMAEIPYAVGFGFVDSIKIVFGVSVILAGFGMYLFASKWGKLSGFLASALYILAPYRIFILYSRGSLGESVALGIIPFIFLAIDRLMKKITWNRMTLLSTTYAALIMSHNVIALLFTPIILLYLFIIFLKAKINIFTFRYTLLALLVGLSLSSFFWFPALWDLQFTKASQITISEYSNYFLSSIELIKMLGFMPIALLSLAIASRSWFFLIGSIVSAFLIHPISSPILSVVPSLEKIQFPWRIATVFMFSSSVAIAQAVYKIKIASKVKKIGVVLTLLALILLSLSKMSDIKFINRNEGFYTTNDDTTTVKNEFTPIWITETPKQRPKAPYKISASQGSFEVVDEEIRTGFQYLQLRLQEDAEITFNTQYFPGWKLYIDDKEITIDPTETNGLIQTKIKPGRDKLRDVKLVFKTTSQRYLSEVISLLTFVVLLFLIISQQFKNKKTKTKIAIFTASLSLISICFFILTNLRTYGQMFEPDKAKKAYENSQWVNPDYATSIPIGDSGLYSWAGWAYLHGENPILINSEMPPLGKYLIGLGLLLTKRPAVIGFIFTLFSLATYYFLAKEIFKDKWLALISTSLLSLEPVITNLLNITMLDALQLGFINLALLFFIKGLRRNKYFLLSSLFLGASASTKFFAGTATVVFALILYLVINKNWVKLKYFIFSLPIVTLIHASSYAMYFIKGNSIRDYLGVQKWIVDFYQKGNVGTIPAGSYWLLVLFNKWRVWFGQEWGKYTTIKSDLWRITWPINLLSVIVGTFIAIKGKLKKPFKVLLIWLVVYSIFLTFIIGWPHYMLLYLPFSYIVLIELVRMFSPKVNKILELKIKKYLK